MRNLLSSKEQRQLLLIETLVHSRQWTHLRDLACKFECTERILKNDLSDLREFFPTINIQSSTNGIRADIPEPFTVEDIYRHFLKESQNFALLEYIFFHEGTSIQEISQDFYTSSANLYRLARNVIKASEPDYQFNIQLSPVSISGNEIDIRYFYAQYFSERYYFLEWPFKDLPEEDLVEFANYFYKPTNYPMRFATFRMYKIMTAISIYRVKSGHFAYLPNSALETFYPIYQQLPDFQEKLTYFSKKLQIELTPETLIQIFISFVQDAIFLDPKNFFQSLKDSEYAKKSYQLLSDMLTRISQQFHVHFENFDELIWYMHNTAHLERQETFSDPILFRQKEQTIKEFEDYFPEFFDILTLELQKYRTAIGHSFTQEHLRHLVYTLFTHTQGISQQLLDNRPPIKVCVISNFDHTHSLTLLDILKYHCNNRFEFEIWDRIETSTDILNQSDYDIIVANFFIQGLEKKFICTNNLPIMELVNHLNSISNDINQSRLEELHRQ